MNKNIVSFLSVVVPLVLLGAIGWAALPKNPSFHGVSPHPYLVIGIFLFYILEFKWTLFLGPALAIQYLLFLHLTVDYDEVVTLWSYTYLSLPGSLLLLTFGIGILKSIRDQEVNRLKKLTEDLEVDALKARDVSHLAIEKLRDLEVKIGLENRGVPEILAKFQMLFKEPRDIQLLSELVKNYFRDCEFLVHCLLDVESSIKIQNSRRPLVEYILKSRLDSFTFEKQLPIELQSHRPSTLYFPLTYEKIPIGVAEVRGARLSEVSKENLAIVQRILDLWSWSILRLKTDKA